MRATRFASASATTSWPSTVPSGALPIFSTSLPQRPQASTRTTSRPSGSARSACSGYPDEFRMTARTEGYRRRVAIKLYRCKNLWVKAGGHPCWRVQNALDEQGIEYELVTGPWPAIGKRHDIERLSGQTKYPVIEFEDGSVYREESKDMAETITAGKLFDKQGA